MRFLACAMVLCWFLGGSAGLAVQCNKGLHQDNFTLGGGQVTLISCADTSKFMGNQGVKWYIKNNTGDKLSTVFEKIYILSCGRQKLIKANILLDPYEAINGGFFSGDLDLGDPIFPAEICGTKDSYLTRVGIQNAHIVNQTLEASKKREKEERERMERERAEAERQRRAQEDAARLEENRRREAAAAREQERTRAQEEERRRLEQRQAEERARQREMERQQIKQNLDHIDSITRQQRDNADASYNSYVNDSNRKMNDLNQRMQSADADLDRARYEFDRQQSTAEHSISKESANLRRSEARSTKIEGELNDTINTYLDKFK
jgi:flagellar biosynthesis GTPase FlhF